MTAKLRASGQSWGTRYLFFCPGCGCDHMFDVRADGRGPSWSFDGDTDRPTVSPSILVRGTVPLTDAGVEDLLRGTEVEARPTVCHLFLERGLIRYLPDCTHRLAGVTCPLGPYEP